MRIVFSKDRAAQLDLLLTSLERNAPPELTFVVWRATTDAFHEGYELLDQMEPSVVWTGAEPDDFEERVRAILKRDENLVSFFCDDDVLFASPATRSAPFGVRWNNQVLCDSIRLGENTKWCYPTGKQQPYLVLGIGLPWEWLGFDGDPGYPGSLDGHTFRTADIRHMLRGRPFRNPTELEDALMAGCFEMSAERPLMACYPRSVLCSVPVNRVSEQSQVRAGMRFPVSAEKLNERFLAGWRLDLDALDFSGVDSAHYEVDLESAWRKSS